MQARIATLKTKLAARLQPFVLGDKEGFKAGAVAEANRLANAAFGEAMLYTIGCGTAGELAVFGPSKHLTQSTILCCEIRRLLVDPSKR